MLPEGDDLQERARAMIAAAVAESQAASASSIKALHITIYAAPDVSRADIRAAIDAARLGTPAADAHLDFSEAPARYICWNCCGLRFEGKDGICPNCEGEALIVPDEILFALNRVET
jgi:Zn finger protein HypA/HybF involved in hydrogenase expression